jgi:hypothetical protein
MRLKMLVALSLVLTGSPCFATDPPASAPTPAEVLRKLGQGAVDELKKPEYADARCALSPLLASDGMTVALSTDAVFSAGDTILSIGGEQLDTTSKHPVVDVLKKHGPTDKLQLKIRRSGHELTVSAQCADAKPYFDAMLEAGFAASKGDFGTCADKVGEARRLHVLNFAAARLSFNCNAQAKRFANLADTSHAYYELYRLAILQAAWSSDALGSVRGTILEAVDKLQKNNAAFLGDDLKRQYDDAVSARASSQLSATTAAATGASGHP